MEGDTTFRNVKERSPDTVHRQADIEDSAPYPAGLVERAPRRCGRSREASPEHRGDGTRGCCRRSEVQVGQNDAAAGYARRWDWLDTGSALAHESRELKADRAACGSEAGLQKLAIQEESFVEEDRLRTTLIRPVVPAKKIGVPVEVNAEQVGVLAAGNAFVRTGIETVRQGEQTVAVAINRARENRCSVRCRDFAEPAAVEPVSEDPARIHMEADAVRNNLARSVPDVDPCSSRRHRGRCRRRSVICQNSVAIAVNVDQIDLRGVILVWDK